MEAVEIRGVVLDTSKSDLNIRTPGELPSLEFRRFELFYSGWMDSKDRSIYGLSSPSRS